MGSIEWISVPVPFGYKFDEPMEVISTGSFGLDRALGIGGLPRGRITELVGPATITVPLALSCIAQAQKGEGRTVFVDMGDVALTADAARAAGVDCSKLLLDRPTTGERAMDVLDAMVRSGDCAIVVVHGLENIVLKPQFGDDICTLPSRLMSSAIRGLASLAHQTGTAVVVLSGKDVPTASSMKFYASVRIQASAIGTLTVDDTPEGTRARFKVIKNKCAVPFKQCEVDVLATGFAREREILDLAVSMGVVCRNDDFYIIDTGELVGEGRLPAAQMLKTNTALCDFIVKEINQ